MPLNVSSAAWRPWAYVATVCAVIIGVAAASLLTPTASAQFYPAFGLIVVVAGMVLGRRAAYLSVGLTALLLAFFGLRGPGFAVADEREALGLILFLTFGVVTAALIGAARDRIEASDAAVMAARSEAEIKQSLLSEFMHRLMNDLSSISFSAAIQARHAETEEARDTLHDLCERISSLGRIYARLQMRGEADRRVEIKSFVEDICQDFYITHLSMRPISIKTNIESIEFTLDRAVLLGISINELLTNAAKYAFNEDAGGNIFVRLREAPGDADQLMLEVEDDGVGPGGVAPKGTGLGQKLIQSMAEQLKGKYSLERKHGLTVAAVTFPRS
jgi:two-component sensor histidine kinase